jgi:RNase P subunit RPR2
MKVTIKNEEKNVQVTQVTLRYDNDDLKEERLKMFFCFNCQNEVIQYKGRVVRIMPFAPYVKLPVFVKCRNCKTLYSFQDIV